MTCPGRRQEGRGQLFCEIQAHTGASRGWFGWRLEEPWRGREAVDCFCGHLGAVALVNVKEETPRANTVSSFHFATLRGTMTTTRTTKVAAIRYLLLLQHPTGINRTESSQKPHEANVCRWGNGGTESLPNLPRRRRGPAQDSSPEFSSFTFNCPRLGLRDTWPQILALLLISCETRSRSQPPRSQVSNLKSET